MWYVFNVAGKLLGQLPYGDGKIDGLLRFYENGDLLAQVTYKNGLIAGYKEFFLDWHAPCGDRISERSTAWYGKVLL